MMLLKSDHAHYITVAGRQLPLIAKKHPRARSFVVRYDARSGCVKVTLPRYASFKSAFAFAESREGWIAAQMGKHQRVPFADGIEIPLFGELVLLRHSGGRGLVSRHENELRISGDKEFLARRVRDYIKQETKKLLQSRAEHYAKVLGVSFCALNLRESTSRWGSCSAKGSLTFCWRLAFAPLAVLDYIACHEVCHLKHHNHSAAFWNTVEQLCPDFQAQERWLKQHGQSVWQWG